MAAANYTNDALKMFYGEITEEEYRNLPRPCLCMLILRKFEQILKGDFMCGK